MLLRIGLSDVPAIVEVRAEWTDVGLSAEMPYAARWTYYLTPSERASLEAGKEVWHRPTGDSLIIVP